MQSSRDDDDRRPYHDGWDVVLWEDITHSLLGWSPLFYDFEATPFLQNYTFKDSLLVISLILSSFIIR